MHLMLDSAADELRVLLSVCRSVQFMAVCGESNEHSE